MTKKTAIELQFEATVNSYEIKLANSNRKLGNAEWEILNLRSALKELKIKQEESESEKNCDLSLGYNLSVKVTNIPYIRTEDGDTEPDFDLAKRVASPLIEKIKTLSEPNIVIEEVELDSADET